MSWYIHPSKQLRDDELPPELVVTNRDGSIEQVYVPYVPEPPHCTMEPDGYWQEQYGYVMCSNCGEIWAFDCDGPKQNKWTCCPHCRATIDYGEEA